MGVRIKEFIDRVGIKSQEELAERLGVTNNTISLWAKGKRYPTHQMEVQLYEMGMTTEELFGKAYPSSANAARDDFDRKSDFFIKKLFDKIDKLEPRG
jgi:transcriptional regulator with XRE-family HTH domain